MTEEEAQSLIKVIFTECQKHFNPNFHQVMWKDNKPDNVKTRAAIMYGLRLTQMSFEAIGKAFTKKRPHSTVLMNLKNFNSLSYDETRPLYGLRLSICAIVKEQDIFAAISYHEKELKRLKKQL